MVERYLDIIFMQDDNDEVMEMLEGGELHRAVEYLSQWDMGNSRVLDEEQHGSGDDVWHTGNYTLSYNLGLGYAGLTRSFWEESTDEV